MNSLEVNIDSSNPGIWQRETEWMFCLGILTTISDFCAGVSWNLSRRPDVGSVWIDVDGTDGFIVVTGHEEYPGWSPTRIKYAWHLRGKKDVVLSSCTEDQFEKWFKRARVISDEQYEALMYIRGRWVNDQRGYLLNSDSYYDALLEDL
jgi:hypothetical protein